MMKLMDCDGHKLAAELEEIVFVDEPLDLALIAETLRELQTRLDATLKVANDLSQSMDDVHKDRVMLANQVAQLTAERTTSAMGA